MAEQQCPVCKRDSYLNPNIRILISPCFHRLCEQCVYDIFAHGYAPCPECQTPLRKLNFISSTFEDVGIEYELRVRKMLLRHFHRDEEEFSSIDSYDDYLEAFEELVFSLLGADKESTIKACISEIKESQSILNPHPLIKKTGVSAEGATITPKRSKISGSDWGIFREEEYAPHRVLSRNYEIPDEILIVYPCAGLDESTVNRFVLYSLGCS